MRALRRILKGRLPRQSEALGPWCLTEDYGGIEDASVYGTRESCRAIQKQLRYPTKLRRVCRVCDGIENLECECIYGDFEKVTKA